MIPVFPKTEHRQNLWTWFSTPPRYFKKKCKNCKQSKCSLGIEWIYLLIYIYNETLCSNENGQTTFTYNGMDESHKHNLHERSHILRRSYCRVPFMWCSGQTYCDRNQSSSFFGEEVKLRGGRREAFVSGSLYFLIWCSLLVFTL